MRSAEFVPLFDVPAAVGARRGASRAGAPRGPFSSLRGEAEVKGAAVTALRAGWRLCARGSVRAGRRAEARCAAPVALGRSDRAELSFVPGSAAPEQRWWHC